MYAYSIKIVNTRQSKCQRRNDSDVNTNCTRDNVSTRQARSIHQLIMVDIRQVRPRQVDKTNNISIITASSELQYVSIYLAIVVALRQENPPPESLKRTLFTQLPRQCQEQYSVHYGRTKAVLSSVMRLAFSVLWQTTVWDRELSVFSCCLSKHSLSHMLQRWRIGRYDRVKVRIQCTYQHTL